MKRIKQFFSDFKAFISRGNIFDMAVGLIIATAFNKIVTSLVNDIIMPLVTWGTGAASLADLSIPLRTELINGVETVTLSWAYGSFLQSVIDFLIIAFSIFIMVKVVTSSQRKFKKLQEEIVYGSKKEVREQRKAVKLQAKAEGRKFKDVWAEHLKEQERLAEEKAKLEAEEKARKEQEALLANPTEQMLLKEILAELKKQNGTEKPKNSKNE